MKMDNKEWIEKVVNINNKDRIYIDCGHGFWEYDVPIRDYNPAVYLSLCTPCYQRMLGYFLENITTIKFDKLRV